MVSEKEAPERVWIGWPKNMADDMWFYLKPEVGNAVEYTRSDLVATAVAAERERCAQIAEDDAMLCQIAGNRYSAKGTANRIAAAIRSQPNDPKGQVMAHQPEKENELMRSMALTNGIELIKAERQRQIEIEGWTADHDLGHGMGEMAIAAACYAVADTDARVTYPEDDPEGSGWPWGEKWWKPKDTIRNLIRAGALIAAEIDREIESQHQRATTQQ